MPTSTTNTTDTLTELLSRLVAMPTDSAELATNYAAMDWVEEQLAGLPLHIERREHNGVPSLVAATPAVRDRKNPKLWLAAHTDVVPGTPAMFEPKIEHGRLYGRGAYDMKFAIAVYIQLLRELGDDLANYDLGLMFTADEEVGSLGGVGWLTEELGYRGQAVLLPDSLKTWQVETGAKGASFWRFTAQGKEAHGSRIWEGDNAVERLLNFLDVLRTHTTVEPCGDPNHNHNTMNTGKINGGLVVNQVPVSAEAEVDFRFTRGTSFADIEHWVHSAQLAVPNIKAEPMPMQIKVSELPQTGPVRLFERLTHEVTGRTMQKVFSHGGTDARWFGKHNIPVITVCPAGGGFHTQNEWIDLTDLARYYEVTRRFVDQWSKVKS